MKRYGEKDEREKMKEEKKKELLKQAVGYFKQPGFQRLWEEIRNRYVSLGRMGGTVTLRGLKDIEQDALEGFFQKDCHHKKTLTISIENIEKALQQTKFSQVSLEELLYAIFPEGFISKKEQKRKKNLQTEKHFQQLYEQVKDSVAGKWFQTVLEEKKGAYLLLKQDEMRDWESTKIKVQLLFRALNHLPCLNHKRQRLAVFASQISGNPHFFDEGTRMFRYLLYGISGICKIPYPTRQDAEKRAELLYQAGILRDDISNLVTCIGVYAKRESGEIHQGIQGFLECGEMVSLNLFHLGQLSRVDSVNKRVFVVENPSIFQKLVEETKGRETIVCSNGQLRLAVLVLLDFLTESDNILFYSGDFDPEGLTIAQKLKNRYGSKLRFWHYDISDYEKSKSAEIITEVRLKQLSLLTDPTLQKIGRQLEKQKLAGYQENIWDSLNINKK